MAPAPPPVRSKGVGGVRPRQASPRALAIAGGVAALVVIAIVLGVVLSRGGGTSGGGSVVSSSDISGLPPTGSATSSVALAGAADANALFAKIPQLGLVLGKKTAPVEMEMFIDVQCPICQAFEVNDLSTIVKQEIQNGKVQLHLQPWAFLGGQGSQSFSGRLGLIAASFQNKGYEYAKVLYDNQGTEESGWLTGKEMAAIAASVNGLEMHKWLVDVNSSAAKSIASDVDKLANAVKVNGTPTILVGRTGSQLHNVESAQEIALNRAPTLQETLHTIGAALKQG
jgi:protein-disulfide isomerase